jgi:hypothetical protein
MRDHRLKSVLLLLAALVALEPAAFAQPKPGSAEKPAAAEKPGSAESAQQADEHFRRGKALLKAGQKREAREAYLAALRLKKSYDVAWNLGNLEITLGLYRDAAEHLSFAVRTYAPSGTTADQLEKAKQRLADAKSHVGSLLVSVNVNGAEVFVDGKPVGRAPLEDTVFVEPGSRVIEAKLARYDDVRQVIQAANGAEQAVALTLVPSAEGPAAGAPGAPGAASSLGAEASSGAASAPGAATGSGADGTSAGGEAIRGGTANPVILIAGTGVAGAALVVGVVSAVLSNGKAGDVDDMLTTIGSAGDPSACSSGRRASECDALHGLRQDRDRLANVSFWSFLGAGVVGAGTLVYALTAPKEARAGGVKAAPLVAAQGGGLMISGTW